MDEAGIFSFGPSPEEACRRNKNHRSKGELKQMIINGEVYFFFSEKWTLTLL